LLGSFHAACLVCAMTSALTFGHVVSRAASPAESQTWFARGINLSGAELNPQHRPAVYGKDYVYPPAHELDYYANKGFTVVRLPYRWERLQTSLFGKLDAAELNRIKSFVAAARARRMRVVLSPHNGGRYFLDGNETIIGTAGLPIAAFADFSRKVAAAFADNDAIYALGLMNEPHDSMGLWKQTAQAGLDAIRAVDRNRLVLAPGDEWSGAWSWRI
jgi:endoglucanase